MVPGRQSRDPANHAALAALVLLLIGPGASRAALLTLIRASHLRGGG
jgi:hypothetical protein